MRINEPATPQAMARLSQVEKDWLVLQRKADDGDEHAKQMLEIPDSQPYCGCPPITINLDGVKREFSPYSEVRKTPLGGIWYCRRCGAAWVGDAPDDLARIVASAQAQFPQVNQGPDTQVLQVCKPCQKE